MLLPALAVVALGGADVRDEAWKPSAHRRPGSAICLSVGLPTRLGGRDHIRFAALLLSPELRDSFEFVVEVLFSLFLILRQLIE